MYQIGEGPRQFVGISPENGGLPEVWRFRTWKPSFLGENCHVSFREGSIFKAPFGVFFLGGGQVPYVVFLFIWVSRQKYPYSHVPAVSRGHIYIKPRPITIIPSKGIPLQSPPLWLAANPRNSSLKKDVQVHSSLHWTSGESTYLQIIQTSQLLIWPVPKKEF